MYRFLLRDTAQDREGRRACGPSVGVPEGKCLFSDSEALPFPGEPRAVFRVYFQYWMHHSIMSKGGGGSTASSALPHCLSQGLATAQVLAWSHWHQQMFQEPTVTSDPLPSLIASGFRAQAEIQRYIIHMLRQRLVTPYCKYSFKLPK